MNQSHDGLPGAAVERSLHLEEYSRSRPASAGSRPRSLLNKVANAAAAAQADDEPEPADAEPWVLEGWGDGPSVSEAAQQAALRLAPHLKNVPTTLVGLGGPGGRRVLSAGPQGRSPLKASEARRKPGSGPPILQTDRRGAAAALRRAPPPRDLEVGDESDLDEPAPAARPAPPQAGGYGHVPGHGSPGQARMMPTQRTSPSLARQPGAALPQQQNATGASTRLGRRDGAASGAAQASPQHAPGAALRQPSPRSPQYRSPSADAYHAANQCASPVPGAGPGPRHASGAARAPPGPAGISAAASHGPHLTPYGHPPLPPHGHLDPISTAGGRDGSILRGAGEAGAGPLDARHGRGSSSSGEAAAGNVPRSSSFSPHTRSDHPGHIPPSLASAGSSKAEPASPHAVCGAPQRLPSPSGSALASPSGPGHHPPPPLPGLAGCRRTSSFRAEAGFSGWDPEAPAVPSMLHVTGQAPGAMSLWVGPTTPGAGTAGLHVSGVPPSRGPPVPSGQQPQRREQLGGNSRLQRGGAAAAAAAAQPAGVLDLSLVPERSSADRQAAGAALLQLQAAGRAGSPDVSGASSPMTFGLPQQDALAEFCAGRSDVGSAGVALGVSGSRTGPPGAVEARMPSQRAASLTGMVPAAPELGPMRVTPIPKVATTAIGRVS